MIEIHSHLLFGLDDGASDLAATRQLLVDYVDQGVTDVICTPHFEPHHYQSPEALTHTLHQRAAVMEAVQQEIERHQMPITLHTGAEILLSADILTFISDPARRDQIKLAGSDYILIEMPRNLSGGFQVLDQLLFRIQVFGLIPILAHPERSMNNPEFIHALQQWIHDGRLLIQVNTSSFVQDDRLTIERQQHYLRRTKHIWELANQNLIHFVASDAHDPVSRPVQQRLAYETLNRSFGQDYAERLLQTNPAKILTNQAI